MPTIIAIICEDTRSTKLAELFAEQNRIIFWWHREDWREWNQDHSNWETIPTPQAPPKADLLLWHTGDDIEDHTDRQPQDIYKYCIKFSTTGVVESPSDREGAIPEPFGKTPENCPLDQEDIHQFIAWIGGGEVPDICTGRKKQTLQLRAAITILCDGYLRACQTALDDPQVEQALQHLKGEEETICPPPDREKAWEKVQKTAWWRETLQERPSIDLRPAGNALLDAVFDSTETPIEPKTVAAAYLELVQ